MEGTHSAALSAMKGAGAASLAAGTHAGPGLEALSPADEPGEPDALQADSPGQARSAAAALPSLAGQELQVARGLRMPWAPLLTAEEVKRGLAYYGSGARLEAVAAKLMAGRPIKIFTLGGSVTKGQGASSPEAAYPSRLFEFISANFPHEGHQLINKGVGATSSGIFAACAEQMVSDDADLVIVELTINEHPDEEYTGKQRQGYEQLLRKLLKLPSRPAVIQVHHYAWWRAEGDGADAGLFYFPAAEAQLTVMSQYYDIPALSLRSAVFPLLQAGVPGFKADKVLNQNQVTMSGRPIPVAAPEERDAYFYYDRSHPADGGHRVIAELIASLLMRAVEREEGVSCAPSRWAQQRTQPELRELPPPMVPGNADAPTTLCAMQEDFRGVVVESEGFEYRAERPNEATFVGQKWGWTADTPGAWAELEFDSRRDATREASHGNWASVYLSHLKSYEGMGTARVACVSGCHCQKTILDGTWEQQATLMQIHGFKVTQHAQCRVRVTVSKKPGTVPQEGHKVTLMAIMVSHYPLRMDTFDRTAEEVAASVTGPTTQASA
ncbi:hypothetical protein ABPG77_007527 [Micractinium sp. CCAP 211/92]